MNQNFIQRAVTRLIFGPEYGRLAQAGTNPDLISLSEKLFSRRATKALTDPYSQHPVVYSCIKLLSDEVAQVPYKIYGPETSGRSYKDFQRERISLRDGILYLPNMGRAQGYAEITEGKLPALFDKPNPLQSGSQFWQGVVTFLSYNGECDIVCDRQNVTQIPEWLLPQNPGFFKPKPEKELIPQYWAYRPPNSTMQVVAPWELIRPRSFNPNDMRRGLSPIAVAMQGLEMNWSSRLYNLAFFENDGTPGGFFLTEHPWKKTQRDDWIQDWERRHGGASNAFRWALLSNIKDVKLVGYSPKDIQFPKLWELSKQELAMIWRVPLSFLSDTARINYATDKAERKALWTDTIIPIIRHLEDIFWAEFFQYIEGGRYWGAFDLSNVEALQEDFATKLDQATKLFDMFVPFNQINARLNLGMENLPWGDTALVNLTMVPITDVVAGATLPQQSATQQQTSTSNPLIRQSSQELFQGFDNEREKYIKVYTKKYKKYLFDLRKHILEKVDEVVRSPETMANIITANQQQWDQALKRAMEQTYLESMGSSIEITASQLGAVPFLTATSPETLAVLALRNNYLVGVNDIIFNNLKTSIMGALAEGQTVGGVRQIVRDVMNFESSRSTTVARTEVGSAMSGARFNEMAGQSVEYTRWLIADSSARQNHQIAQGLGPVRLGEVFGPTRCRYPLDSQGPAKEVINCRCVSVPARGPN